LRLLSYLTVVTIIGLILASNAYASSQEDPGFEARVEAYASKASNNTLTGFIRLEKGFEVGNVTSEAKLFLEARLASLRGDVNFTLALESNTTKSKVGNATRLSSSFKARYTDYAMLARLAGSSRVSLEAMGNSEVTLDRGMVGVTLKTSITPVTGNAMMDRALAALLASILNDTLKDVSEGLRRGGWNVSYKVSLAGDGRVVSIEANLGRRLELRTASLDIAGAGSTTLKLEVVLERNVTRVQVSVETRGLNLNLRESAKELSTLNTSLGSLLENINTLLQSANTLISSLNSAVERVGSQIQQPLQAPPAQQTSYQESRKVEAGLETVQATAKTTEEQGRSRITLTLILATILVMATLAASYIVLARRA